MEIMKEYLTQERTDKLFNTITANGCRDMEEDRFHQAVNEAISISNRLVKPEIADTLKKMEQEYSKWLTLPRYQIEDSDEYYADIQTIIENLQTLINKRE